MDRVSIIDEALTLLKNTKLENVEPPNMEWYCDRCRNLDEGACEFCYLHEGDVKIAPTEFKATFDTDALILELLGKKNMSSGKDEESLKNQPRILPYDY